MPAREKISMEDSDVKSYANQNFESFNCFDEFITFIQSINVVQIDRSVWELSTCNCKLCSFKEIAMNIPLERKRRPGRPKATTSALIRQPNETQLIIDIDISSCDESDSESISNETPPEKRIRVDQDVNNLPKEKRKRGRPAGSKNKK
ncbi:unnamed protein product [Brachionus calyciflorus]|uniref:Uncharacterized protein n=1 Tax=Brachionus calyciflorus TaxID=104777 RepID=A0A814FEA3_9BILA|nr:unnamed protein product [Brachionus calyciflorus]